MSTELLSLGFQIASWSVLPFWAMLILMPDWEAGARLIAGAVVPALLAAAYLALLAAGAGAALLSVNVHDADLLSLGDLIGLFQVPVVALAGWLHYLAFDLFVGAWIARDSRRMHLSLLLLAPVLLLTLVLGPLGLLLYLLLRFMLAGRLAAD